MPKMNINFLLTFILLLPVIYCNKDHLEDQDELDKKNWMQFLPNHVQHIIKSKMTTTTTAVNDDEVSSNSTDSLISGEIMNWPGTTKMTYGINGGGSSAKSVSIGASIGGIILFCLICYCCFRCCCRRETISQGVVIQPMHPPPPPQDFNQPNIVIQHIHPAHQYQPGMVQQVHQSHAPPPMVTAPQFQQPPPYPVGYETQQMLQQEWSPHAPMHQQQQHYPVPDYPYNPSAPPPSYGKY